MRKTRESSMSVKPPLKGALNVDLSAGQKLTAERYGSPKRRDHARTAES
jgi:hypothetical protein